MSEHVFVRPLHAPRYDGTYEWVVRGEGASFSRPEQGDAATLAQRVGNVAMSLVLNAELVGLLEAHVPGRSQRLVEQAAPYAVEEEISTDLDAVHIVVGPGEPNSTRPIAVIGRELLGAILAPLQDAGVKLRQAIAESLLLPLEPGTLSILLTGERAVLRYGAYAGAGIEAQNLMPLVRRLCAEDAPTAVHVYAARGTPLSASLRTTLGSACQGATVNAHPLANDAFTWLAQAGESGAGFDCLPRMLRDDAKRHRGGSIWKVAASVAALAVLAHLALERRAVTVLEQRLADIEAAQTKIFRRAFPEVKRIVDAETQAEQALADLRAVGPVRASFLEAFHDSAAVLHADPSLGLELSGATFADGVLMLRTEGSAIEQLEAYREALPMHLVAEVVNAEAQGDTVRGAVRIQQGAQ